MVAQPIYPDELNHALDNLYTRLSRYISAQLEAITIQTRTDINNAKLETTGKIEQFRQETNERLSSVESTQTQLIENQNLLISTFNTTTQALAKTMQDNHAEAMEAINDVKARVTKLEEKQQ